MSAVNIQGPSELSVGPLDAHVFRCPYCRKYTTLVSPHSFISEGTAECHNCTRIFVIENDIAHPLPM